MDLHKAFLESSPLRGQGSNLAYTENSNNNHHTLLIQFLAWKEMKEKARLLWRRWESWNESAGPGLESQHHPGLLGTGDIIVKFWKQPPNFEYWLEIKAVWLPDICVTPLKPSGPLLSTSEKFLKHIWSLAHTERGLKNIQMGTGENLGVPFLHSSSPKSKRCDCTLQKIFHKVHRWWKTAFYSEGLFTECNLIIVSYFKKGLLSACSFGYALLPHQPDYVVSWKVRSGLCSSRIHLDPSPSQDQSLG